MVNYFAALRYVEKQAGRKAIFHEDVLRLRKIIAARVIAQGGSGALPDDTRPGRTRLSARRPMRVSGLMHELLEWWNKESHLLSPVLTSAIVHYQFEAIHPFADGNGRTGLTHWRPSWLRKLYRHGVDTHHIVRREATGARERPCPAISAALKQGGCGCGRSEEPTVPWLEYTAEATHLTLESRWGNESSNCLRERKEEARAAPEAGTVAAPAARERQPEPERRSGTG